MEFLILKATLWIKLTWLEKCNLERCDTSNYREDAKHINIYVSNAYHWS